MNSKKKNKIGTMAKLARTHNGIVNAAGTPFAIAKGTPKRNSPTGVIDNNIAQSTGFIE